MDSTSHIKQQRKAAEASTSFARVFARCSQLNRLRLTADLDYVAYDVLRKGRVRLDVVAMLTTRLFVKNMVDVCGDSVWLYIWCDASPQARGLELFSATVEIYDGKSFVRKLMPCVALDNAARLIR